eukprot:1160729-Pelagomonas_calceolata.AAC.2
MSVAGGTGREHCKCKQQLCISSNTPHSWEATSIHGAGRQQVSMTNKNCNSVATVEALVEANAV